MKYANAFDTASYIKRINKVESMLDAIKKDLSKESKLQLSITQGEENIKEGRATICRSEQELDAFFDSI